MQYLKQDEVALIFHRWLTRRVKKISEPTKFMCAICTEPGFGKYLHVCTDTTQPQNSIFICEFDVENPNDFPDIRQIKQAIEKQWQILSEIKRIDYENELKEAKENI